MNREEETLGFYEMGNNESRIEEEEEDSQQSPHHDSNVVSAGGALLDEQEVIHYAAAAERLLASHSMASSNAGAVVPSKKAKRKKGAHKDEQPLPIAPPPPAPYRGEMSVASAVAAAAAALKEREIQAKATTSTTAPEASASTVPDGGEEGKTEVTEKRKRRKKKQRQTSQEEESAQALLALNKGGLGSSGGVDSAENENAIIDEDDVAAVAEPSTPSKKGKKKKRSKKQPLSEEMVIDEEVEEASLLKNTNGDAEMADEFAGQFVDASSAAAADIAVVPGGVAGNVTTIAPIDQAGLPHLDIPDQRIITEHLAAHMAKIPSASGEDMMVEQRLMSELQGIHPTVLGTDGFTASTPNGDGDLSHQLLGPTPSSRSAPRKRKRDLPNNTTQLNGLVDPQLMQIDEEAALAAGDGDTRKRKRRTAQPVGFVEGAEVTNNIHSEPAANNVETATVTVATENQTTVAQQKVNSWGSTTVNSTGDPPNGGTFSLEERFAIDKALQDYSKIHGMTMDELKDRVWGNNRKKDEFWDFISSAVPNRSRASVYKHVRRSCHIFQQRAKWTPEEDAELDALVKEKGNKWKDIGEAMGRMGEDCRDRYRNYVKCGDDRGKDRWSEEEEELLKKTVREHKENTRQILIQQGKPLPSPEEEDSVLINWTTVSEMMKNRRSRIQCRYKWKKMLAQKEKVKQAPIGVTYVGGKKKRISFDIEKMKPGDKQWLLHLIRDCPATQENEIPWDQFAKNDKEVGIWTWKDLKNAYKSFRGHIPHKRRPLSEIIKQLLAELERDYTPEERKQRFVPSQNGDDAKQHQHSASGSPAPAPPNDTDTPHTPADFEQLYEIVAATPGPGQAPVAPVANMSFAQQPAPVVDPIVDPELMGQGMHELQKMAGEAIAHSTAMQHNNEDDEERELRTRLGGFIQDNQGAG